MPKNMENADSHGADLGRRFGVATAEAIRANSLSFQAATWFILATKRLRLLAAVAVVSFLHAPTVRH